MVFLFPYYYHYCYSPCGKKFRSKPQIARFLGESADLTAFDFSRAGTPGDGSSRRRARDRTTRRAIEPTKAPLILVKPLSNNPLRPSGPIRRTCGVIKLPVTWVSPPSDEEAKMTAIKLHEEAVDSPSPPPNLLVNSSAGMEGNEDPTTTDQSKTSKVPPPSTTSVVMVPALWENRLQGVMAYDFETGNEIKVNLVEKLHNGSTSSTTGTATTTTTATTAATSVSNSGGRGGQTLSKGLELKQAQGILGTTVRSTGSLAGDNKFVLNALLAKQLMQQRLEEIRHPPTIGGGGVVPSLLAHGLGVVKGVANKGPIAVVPSLKTMKENGGSLKQQNMTQGQFSGNIILTLPTVASANSFKQATNTMTTSSSSTQRQNVRKVGSIPIPNGPALPGSNTKKGMFVSESELRLQEEKVRLLREQLMAAQSTA